MLLNVDEIGSGLLASKPTYTKQLGFNSCNLYLYRLLTRNEKDKVDEKEECDVRYKKRAYPTFGEEDRL